MATESNKKLLILYVLDVLKEYSDFEHQLTQADIIGKIPSEYWTNFSHLLIHHGRQCCNARKPECEKCFLKNYCLERSAGMKKTSKVKNK